MEVLGVFNLPFMFLNQEQLLFAKLTVKESELSLIVCSGVD